jgi:hypothetical protein
MASVDSVFGRLKEFEYAVPTDFKIPSDRISTTAQMMSTRRRCVTHHRAKLRINV